MRQSAPPKTINGDLSAGYSLGLEFLWMYAYQDGWWCVYHRHTGQVRRAFNGREGLGRWPRDFRGIRWTPDPAQCRWRGERAAQEEAYRANGLGEHPSAELLAEIDATP